MDKRIMILGAGILQIPAIRRAKEMGYVTVVADMDPNAPGFAYADKQLVISTIDIPAVLEAAREYQVNGIMTLASDMPMRTVAHVGKALGLPAISEEAAFRAGGRNYHAPAQRVGDFLAGKPSTGPGKVQPTYRPGVTWCDLHTLLPEKITRALAEALPQLDGNLSGFADADSVLTAPETRSSSPVRILRGGDMCSLSLAGLYPCGEGAGYAGGITSAAVDGMRVAEAILEKYK